MSLVYWDTMLFVYWLEGHSTYAKRVQHILSKMEARRDRLCTSVFTVAEVLVGPYKVGDSGTVKRIQEAFDSPFIEILPFNQATADRYAQIRAQHGVSAADAIHLACAAQSGIDLFLTNDAALPGKVISGIQFIAKLDTNLF
ncbi:MAG TPA: PIN domain-containing protein [Candidatus Angelobacter sp.]|jgi:predicted nucleic acid-binding protein|nr:PIN domain-containing protein [Candidatus Angelobacter sp.]